MSEHRKAAGESWESFSDRLIRKAQQEGAFNHLPGMGKPIEDLDVPYDEDWWIKKKLRDENLSLTPPALEARLDIERTLENINSLNSEFEVRRRLETLNERVRQAHFSHVPGPADGARPVDIEAVVTRWRQQNAPQ